MDVFITDAWMGGGICTYVGNVLHCGSSGNSPLWVGGVGHVPTYWEGAGRFSSLVDTAADGADTIVERGKDVDIPPPGGGNGGGDIVRGGDLCRPPPEHFRAIY